MNVSQLLCRHHLNNFLVDDTTSATQFTEISRVWQKVKSISLPFRFWNEWQKLTNIIVDNDDNIIFRFVLMQRTLHVSWALHNCRFAFKSFLSMVKIPRLFSNWSRVVASWAALFFTWLRFWCTHDSFLCAAEGFFTFILSLSLVPTFSYSFFSSLFYIGAKFSRNELKYFA